MTLHARIEGFISLTLAEIDIGSVALLVGHNAAGKSALIDGIACATTGRHGVRDVTAKKDLAALLHDGYREASARIWDDAGNSSSIQWPRAEAVTTGEGIFLDAISAGLTRLSDVKPAERVGLLWEITKGKITDDDIKAALVAAKIPETAIGQVLERCRKDGMDGAVGYYKDKRVRQKGAWEAATGESYGALKAEGWAPEGWTPDLDKETEAGLKTAIDLAKGKLEQAVGESAVSAERRKALEAAAEGLPAAKAKFDLADSDVATYQDELTALAGLRAKLPAMAPHGHLRCPKCKAAIEVKTGPGHTVIELAEEGEKVDDAELKSIRLKIAELDGKISQKKGVLSNAEALRQSAKQALDAAQRAQGELDGLAPGETTAGDPTALRDAVSRAEGRLRRFSSKAAADVAHRQILGLEVLVQVLGPDGIKRTKTKAMLDRINAEFAQMCEFAEGFPAVAIGDDLTIRAGVRPYGLLSTGYKYFADAVMQVALARLQGKPLVLLDGADVLTGDNRAGLLKMVVRAGVPAVISMAVKRAQDVPDLAKMKLGKTYWIEDGRCKPVSE